MDKERKRELVQRSLGIRHKLKVHESIELPDTHEEIAAMMLAKWELEDELHAIEQILAETRHENVQNKRHLIEDEHIQLVKKKVYDSPSPGTASDSKGNTKQGTNKRK